MTEHHELAARLSRMSVLKHFDAYADIDWDAPAYAIDADDPRWEIGPDDPIGGSAWYRALPAGTRSRLGLHRIAATMKMGWQFESVLKRGLLEHAAGLPDGSPDVRYLYHEVIEEAQHSLMFMEFARRAQAAASMRLPGLPRRLRPLPRRVVALGHRFPELFFIFVLGGEDPIDHVQRQLLASVREVHPLVKRIMQIHVTEEARHISFARSYLRVHVPRLTGARRLLLAIAAPLVLGVMGRLMLRPGRLLVRTYGIPDELVRHPVHAERMRASLAKVRELCIELGLVGQKTAVLWKAMGLGAWDPS
jgi:hypothetical protein